MRKGAGDWELGVGGWGLTSYFPIPNTRIFIVFGVIWARPFGPVVLIATGTYTLCVARSSHMVRPDGMVAWRTTGAVEDPASTLWDVLGRVLSR